jgi:hypothetical protein
MIQLTANEATLAVLSQAVNDLAEIRDTDGKVIGYFAPVALDDARLYADVAAHYDAAEMKRRKEDGSPGRTTAEVLERLQSLENT